MIIHLIIICSLNSLWSQGFVDQTKELGLEHIHVIRSYLGGGAVFVDYDNDGWQDIYLTGGEVPDKLYRNIEGRMFKDVSFDLPFVKGSKISTGVVALDFDNNGCRDLFITTLNKDFPNVLLRNNCDGFYTNVSVPAGISHGACSMGANIQDINLDGFPDIYVINYVEDEKFIENVEGEIIGYDHTCQSDFLYINNGDGTFAESSEQLGVGNTGCGLAVTSLGFLENDARGYYIANDFGEWIEPNVLLNVSDPSDNAGTYGLDIGLYGMGIAVGDIDNDQDFDLYITNIGKNALMVNQDNLFQNQASAFNIENEFVEDSLLSVSWGSFFADLDNDMDLDLFVSNGTVPTAPFLAGSPFDPSVLYVNNEGTMTDMTLEWGLRNLAINRGAIFGDYNNDGFLDILVTSILEDDLGSSEFLTFKLFKNKGSGNNYIKLILEGAHDRDAFGSIITLYAEDIARKQVLLSSATHASQHEKAINFGLSSLNSLDSILVKWPNGNAQTFTGLEINSTYQLSQVDGSSALLGCTDPESENYDPNAQINHGCIAKFTSRANPIEELSVKLYVGGNQLYFEGELGSRGHLSIKVFNAIGQLVLSRPRHDLSAINLGALTSGIYTALINFDGLFYSKKIVVVNE